MVIVRIVSGTQTTAGIAALDAAVELDLPYDGWRPKTPPWKGLDIEP